jgi:hypothetical protein
MLFFGVPNLGLRNDQLKTLVRGQPNEALIRDLLVDDDSEPSNFLKRLADQFSESCKGYYRVVSFFERRLSRTLRVSLPVGDARVKSDPCPIGARREMEQNGGPFFVGYREVCY